MTFGEKLTKLRKQANLSQKQLAEKLSLSRQVISKWEKGVGLPDIDNLVKISKLFNVTIDDLLDYKLEKIDLKLDETIEKIDKKDAFFKNVNMFILHKFADFDEIFALSQEINLNIWQEIFYSIFDIDLVLEFHDFIQNGFVFPFFVIKKDEKYLVLVKKSMLMTKRLDKDFVKRHLIVDGYRYEKIKKLK